MSVIAVSGHMVDSPDRPRPRFPPDQVPRVEAEVRSALDGWDVGPGTTVVSGGARGADVIAGEQALARGARVKLVLALPPDEFERRSVALSGTDWAARFRRLLQHAEVEVVGSRGDADDVFECANTRIIEVARALGGGRPRALVVWDGNAGDGPGGTSDFVERLGYDALDENVRVIDPTPPG